jgi:6-phosphogluconolactonase
MEPGAGPRHFDFHPRGKTIFVISELNSTITSFKFQNRRWKEFQTISTLPSDFKGESYCADIHVSADGRFLYGSNRGDNSIATFVIVGNTHQLISVGNVGTVGNWPRNFTLSPDGRFMLVANQRSGNITVFEINEESGIPEFTGKEIKLPSPVCLEFL